jgi:glyoxylase-like metal-dependent hydrolase (beta-lactamase superfamily II)
VSDFLKAQKDPNHPIPDETFVSQKTMKLGGKTVELTRHFYHSNEGDLFIYVPGAKFMMAVDYVTPGYIPFSGFDITTNFDQYLKVFDELLAYDFTTFCGGHLTSFGDKKDVEMTKEFTMDVYHTVKRIHNSTDQQALVAEAAKTIGTDNKFLLFKVIFDKFADEAVQSCGRAGSTVWLVWMSGWRVR